MFLRELRFFLNELFIFSKIVKGNFLIRLDGVDVKVYLVLLCVSVVMKILRLEEEGMVV